MLRTLKQRLRLERLRQLWMQCDLFDSGAGRTGGEAGREEPRALAPRPAPPRSMQPRPETVTRRPLRRATDAAVRPARAPRTHRDDLMFVHRLQVEHAQYNATLFGGELQPVVIRVSRRMKNRLGHYMEAGKGLPAEIAISRRHIMRDPWDDVLHTLVHEMVHQWQDENGHPLDHSQVFRRKAHEVGISARATRPADYASVGKRPRLAARAVHRRGA